MTPREEAINRMSEALGIDMVLADRLVINGIHTLAAMDGVEHRDLLDCGFSQSEATLIMTAYNKACPPYIPNHPVSPLRSLMVEAADSIHASLAEDGISDDRRQYRKGLEARIRKAICSL